MPVLISRGASSQLSLEPERATLVVRRIPPGSEDAALAALAAAVRDVTGPAGATGPVRVTGPVLSPLGPLVVVDASRCPDRLVALPEAVARRLRERRVTDGFVTAVEPGGRLDDLVMAGPAAVIRLVPEPGSAVPALWLEALAELLAERSGTVTLRIAGTEHDVPTADVPGWLVEAAAAGVPAEVLAGDLRPGSVVAALVPGTGRHVAVAVVGDGDRIFDGADRLVDLGRELAATVAWAGLGFEDATGVLQGPAAVDAAGRPVPWRTVLGELGDRIVPDAGPWQILGPGHLERLGAVIGEPLDAGRREVIIGDLGDWVGDPGVVADVRAEGRELLGPLLAGDVDLTAAPARPAVAPVTLPGDDGRRLGVSVWLDRHPHPHRGARLTPLELLAWRLRQPHTDHPAGVPPTLETLLRHLGAGLDDAIRQEMLEPVLRAVGAGGDPVVERARRWACTRWLIRTAAAAWLRAAGDPTGADHLAGLEASDDSLVMVVAADALGRVIEARAAGGDGDNPGGDDGDAVDEAVWVAWERAAEESGVVAVAEAAVVDVPDTMVEAVDLRVVELARDPSERRAAARRGASLADEAWVAAVRAAASVAWRAAWDAASAEVASRAGGDLEALVDRDDAATEAAHARAREVLARVALQGEGPRAFDRVRSVLDRDPASAEWARRLASVADTVGPAAFEAALAAARRATATALADAADRVARCVLSSLAREACGILARSMARDAVRSAAARGADPDEAARGVLAPVAAGLASSAVDLLADVVDLAGGPDGDPTVPG